MNIASVKTHKITTKDTSITAILDKYVTKLSEKSIVAVTSKIVAITQGRVVAGGTVDKDELVKTDAQWYIPRKYNTYGFCFTITHNRLIASAGIDESNGNGDYILWPENPQKAANTIREHLSKKHNVKHVGVIITDSHVLPLQWGVIGISLAHSGFVASRNYIGKPDIFGKKLSVTHQSNTEGLAAAADVVMGGAAEQTPLAVISDVNFIEFQQRNPTKQELEDVLIEREGDVFWPLMKNAPWEKGGS